MPCPMLRSRGDKDNDMSSGFTEVTVPINRGYSRAVVPLSNGRVFVISGGPYRGNANSVVYRDVELP